MTLSSHVKHGEVEIQEVLRNSKKNGKICFLSVIFYKLLYFLNTLENSVLSVSCWNLHDYYFVFVGKISQYFELKGLLKLTKTFMYLMFQTVTKRIKRMMQAFVAGKGSKRMKRNTIKTKMHQKRKNKLIGPGAQKRKRLFCCIFPLIVDRSMFRERNVRIAWKFFHV